MHVAAAINANGKQYRTYIRTDLVEIIIDKACMIAVAVRRKLSESHSNQAGIALRGSLIASPENIPVAEFEILSTCRDSYDTLKEDEDRLSQTLQEQHSDVQALEKLLNALDGQGSKLDQARPRIDALMVKSC